jgi:diaminopimelate epimerase
MTQIEFLKMHGCGNDFVVFDDAAGRFGWDELAALAPGVCDRRFGVGADGIIAVGRSTLADYEMRYVNADGSIAEMCGNGIRCVGKFVAEELGETQEVVQVLTRSGILPIQLHREADGRVGTVTVGMGQPRLVPADVPTTLAAGDGPAVAVPLSVNGSELAVTAVSMGNPHAVCFVDRADDYHVLELGPQIERHSAFPAKTNVEFIEVHAPDRLRMRVWERGCGETWACGTGACASVVAAVINGHVQHGTNVTVSLNGGDLTINWPDADSAVLMTGAATTVYRGMLRLPS